MKKLIVQLCATLLIGSATMLQAHDEGQAPKASAEFEKLKSLVGTWQGKVDIGQGPVDMTVDYRLIAGGTVLEERVFAGTPNEMTTMFYDKDGKLALTHYCVMGNRPAMVLKSSDSKTLRFDFDTNCGIDQQKEAHMHSMSLTFDSPESITTTCRSLFYGKMQENATTLKRVKKS
ncbi:MAG: hypothetical protein ACTHMT_13895 [Verrucomicrobiota bacterium]|jgi:hypothetical protein